MVSTLVVAMKLVTYESTLQLRYLLETAYLPFTKNKKQAQRRAAASRSRHKSHCVIQY